MLPQPRELIKIITKKNFINLDLFKICVKRLFTLGFTKYSLICWNEVLNYSPVRETESITSFT